MNDQLFASFMLDEKKGMEIALQAVSVTEAAPFNTSTRKLPTSIDYLEGIMPLRGDIIPVINLKKRLGLEEHDYGKDAKVAIVSLYNQQFGLLFDDIKEVFQVDPDHILPVGSLLQSDDRIISAIIKRDQGDRTAELLDLGHLFKGHSPEAIEQLTKSSTAPEQQKQITYSRWVVFTCLGQNYGVPVQFAKEIAFFSKLDDTFKSGRVEGAIELRNQTIPVLDSRYLLADQERDHAEESENRVLILASEDCSFGMIVDKIKTILTLADDSILPVSSNGSENLLGIYPQENDSDVLLLNLPNLVCNQIDEIKSLTRINKGGKEDITARKGTIRSHHVITENCYLVFSIDRHLAIELKDVQEIIENENILQIPHAEGYNTSVINLRGKIVPVINTRRFYGYPDGKTGESKLIICNSQSRTIALEVDQIITIYKQEEYHSTPSLNPRFAEKKDTLDRLIEYLNGNGLKEHVLVVNVHNLIRNHLESHSDQEGYQVDGETQLDTRNETNNING